VLVQPFDLMVPLAALEFEVYYLSLTGSRIQLLAMPNRKIRR
jgi:hypothetical protein